MSRWENVRKKTCCRVPAHKTSEITIKNETEKQAPIEWRPNQFKLKKFPSDKFCTQIILFYRYTTTRRKIRTSMTSLKVMLHWPTCNAHSQRMFLARICRHVTLLNRFQKLATRCSTANIAKNRFRATSYHCKLALQVDQCNTTLSLSLVANTSPEESREGLWLKFK